jgi:cellobiose phosphorylase
MPEGARRQRFLGVRLIDAVVERTDATVGSNPYGYFDEAAREYVITRPDTPAP